MTARPLSSSASTPGSTVVRVTDLKKHYRRGRVEAVKEISFEVHKGRVYGLIGPDGAGKTSVMQILAGVLSANSGKAEVSGIDVLKRPEAVKPIIGYMPQGLGLNLYDTLTVVENIEFFRDLRQVPEHEYRENRERLLAMTRLEPFLDRPAGKLSGGMRQKLALICTLIHLPDILLLDEPTTGVDPLSRRDFWTIIHELVTTREVTVLLTTAYMDEAERCHHVALMHDGTIIAEGRPDELTAELTGELVAVKGPQPRTIFTALRGWQMTESVALFGSEVHVLLKHNGQELKKRLKTAGLAQATTHKIPPGLEDVFVHHLVTSAAAAPAPAQPGAMAATVKETGQSHAVVQVQKLTCRFGEFIAVDDVSFSVHPGEIFGLLGPNGAGKTTLIRMLCGLQTPSEGAALVAGHDVWHERDALRERIGYMSQRFSLYRDLRVWENVELYAGLYGLGASEFNRRGTLLLESLGLSPYRDRATGSLPLGLRQRLALACAQLHRPPVLFLDEPTSGVDPVARRQFWDIVHLLAQEQGITVLVSTHYMDEAEHCDRLALMQDGKLVATGDPASLKETAKTQHGPLIAVRAEAFAEAFHLLRSRFSSAMLYGRSVQWQSTSPEDDMKLARKRLADAGIDAQVSLQELTMEETFVSYMEAAD